MRSPWVDLVEWLALGLHRAPDEEFDVSPSAEVGLDLSFDHERRVVLRAAAALGDRSALILGFALGGGG
ncbi:MAG: hypothetical protein ACOC8K_08400 [Gemmatimonadota bacterium]